VNYLNNYGRITLPISIVTMELDSLADLITTKQEMFNHILSKETHFTCWDGLGHEDHFANRRNFTKVLEAIRKVC
jgi:hypothetical protein